MKLTTTSEPGGETLPCGHPEAALNHPPGTIPAGQVRTVYCTACVQDHREAEREVIDAAKRAFAVDSTAEDIYVLSVAVRRLLTLEGGLSD